MKRKKAISIFSILFIIILLLVTINLFSVIDSSIYYIITYKVSGGITNFWKFITFFGSVKFIIILCVIFLIIFFLLKKKWYGLYINFALILSTVVNNIIKVIIGRPRPSINPLVVENSYSFPSGHMMASTMMYGLLIYFILKSNMSKKTKYILVLSLAILTTLIGISRIYLGVHYFSDILAGFILSLTLLLVVIELIEKHHKI